MDVAAGSGISGKRGEGLGYHRSAGVITRPAHGPFFSKWRVSALLRVGHKSVDGRKKLY